MRFTRKHLFRAVALAAVGLGLTSAAEAQVCQHIGVWTRTDNGFVCAGERLSGNCVWTDDCRKSVE
jgi:hypothetical protein